MRCKRRITLNACVGLCVYTGPGRYDAVPEAHPMTQYSTGYNYPTTVKPEVVQMCEVIFFLLVFSGRI